MSSEGDDGTFRYRKEKTEVLKRKVSVRMTSGKVYGPYRRSEILSFISSKRIRGEEEILYEGEVEWQPIASDPEFFDALHAILEGRSPNQRSEADELRGTHSNTGRGTAVGAAPDDEIVAKTEAIQNPSHQAAADDEEEAETNFTEVEEDNEGQGKVATKAVDQKREEKLARGPEKKWTPKHAVSPRPVFAPHPELQAKKKKKANKLPLWIGMATIAVIALLVADEFQGRFQKTSPAKIVDLQYFDSLKQAMRLWKNREIPVMPAEISNDGPPIRIGGNAEAWAKSLQQAMSPAGDLEQRKAKGYWVQMAWDLAALAAVLQVQQVDYSKELRQKSEAILSELERKGVLETELKNLFQALDHFRVSKFELAQRIAEPLNMEAARWIYENCSWLIYWETKQKNNYFGSASQFSEPAIDLESRVRRLYAMRDPTVGEALEQLADENAFSETLWFANAAIIWKEKKGAGVAAAGQSFVAGMLGLALYFPAVQVKYWREYGAFLKSYGRQSSVDVALKNMEMIGAGNIALSSRAKNWRDLGAEGLDPLVYSEGLMSRARTAELGPSEMAALKVFGRMLPEGNELLNIVAVDLLLKGKLQAADGVIEQMLRRKPDDKEAIGLKVWLDAENFSFFEAMSAIEKSLGVGPAAQKYRLPLLVIGREYPGAEALIKEINQSRPQDAWADYWKARMKKALNEPKACMVAANLARLQNRGSLGRGAEVLRMQCQIMAKVGLEKLVEELQGIRAKTLDARYLALISDTYLAMEQPQKALEFLKTSLVQFSGIPDLLLALGRAHEKLRDIRSARQAYETVALRDSSDARGLLEIGRMAEASADYLEAARTYQVAAIVNPRVPEVFLKAARNFEKADRVQEAAKMYSREIEERPSVLGTFIEAATFLLKNNAPQSVPELYRKFASGGFEQDPRALLRLAQAYYAMEDFENARISSATALKVDPTNAEIYLILAKSLEKLGEYPTARSYYQRYLALNPRASDAAEIQDMISRPPFSAD